MRLFCLFMLILVPLTIFAAPQASIVTAPLLSTVPVINGVIAPGEWDQAATTCGFRDITSGYPAQAATRITTGYDAKALYLLWQCSGEAAVKRMGKANGPRDSTVWNDSTAEFFIAPEKWAMDKYAHLMFSHAGVIADELCEKSAKDLSWNPAWQIAVSGNDTDWFAEVAIPWASLDVVQPTPGQAFRTNFARNAAGINELISWAPVTGFHEPASFGRLVLGGAGPAASIQELPARATGPAEISAQIRGTSQGVKLQTAVINNKQQKTALTSFTPNATAKFYISPGTTGLNVIVSDSAKNVIWSQSVTLSIPDFPAKLNELDKQLSTMSSQGISVEFASLKNAITTLREQISKPLAPADLMQTQQDINTLEFKISDLSLLAEAVRQNGSKNKLVFFVTNPPTTLKVQPSGSMDGPLASNLKLVMARGEYETLQLVVCSVRKRLQKVKISTSELKGPGGNIIPADRLVTNPLGFVNCVKPTSGAKLTGLIPDVLLPDREMNVARGERQPYFITVQTLASDQPGTYTGSVTVEVDGAPAVKLPLSVRVYSLTIPVKSHLRSAFVLWGSFRPFMQNTSDSAYMDTYINYSRALLTYRLSPITMWSPKKNAAGEWDFSDYDRYLDAVLPDGLTTLNIGGNGEVASSRNVDFAKAAAAYLQKRNDWDLHYVYGWDEAPGDVLDQLVSNYRALTDEVPGLKIMQTGWMPNPKLNGLVKIWCPLTPSVKPDSINDFQASGDELWWYVCCVPTAPYANLFIDYPGIDHRVLGWQTFQNKVQGFLYWGTDVWPGNNLSLAEYDAENYANWNPNSFGNFNGDGYLLYPGPKDSPLASMRLALLRDGFEDYDVFTEATALSTDKKRGKKLMELLNFDELMPSLTQYTANGDDLLNRREAILKSCEEIIQSK